MGREESYQVQETPIRGKPDGWTVLKRFIWNPDKKAFCGRNGRSWALIGSFYLVFYTLLAGFFSGMLYVSQQMLDDDKPSMNMYDNGGKHPMLNQPGLGFQPMIETNHKKVFPAIKYSMSDATKIQEITTILQNKIQGYTEDVTLSSCDGSSSSVCSLNIDDLGACDGRNDTDFGYSSGEPCVLIKLNKIIGWTPVPHTSNPDSSLIGDRWNTTHISISCEQESSEVIGQDICSGCLGEPDYFPSLGFPVTCFPYCGVQSSVGYSSPIVMVKFRGLTIGEKVNVGCRVWASNLEYSAKDKAASVRFAFEVEQ